MTLDTTTTRRPIFGFAWLSRIATHRRARNDDRFTPIADLPPYLLYDIGVQPDRLDHIRRGRW